eukprot:gnl/MRDRNA2_/MRDRNA2_16505_c0_seq1.p1 gnl/MRDRNA2_/MRDRNA2_16505_c0~~gnl/MRDRNA2_/MRDRNA2_16505_c0_seq1.p1  ORF type:complete len:471 (+),score=80.61 gnl/MRDRNA2_/MRDRNA2_16505_c0_seq1:99-1511(+)
MLRRQGAVWVLALTGHLVWLLICFQIFWSRDKSVDFKQVVWTPHHTRDSVNAHLEDTSSQTQQWSQWRDLQPVQAFVRQVSSCDRLDKLEAENSHLQEQVKDLTNRIEGLQGAPAQNTPGQLPSCESQSPASLEKNAQKDVQHSHVILTKSLNGTFGKHRRLKLNEYEDAFLNRGLAFLRIQKTGSTSFQVISSEPCKLQKQPSCFFSIHADWNLLMRFHPDRLLLTFFRDPVERLVSEFLYLQNVMVEGQIQWDYNPQMQLLVSQSRSAKVKCSETIPGFQCKYSAAEFSALPGNPSNNRQLRYVLGFDRPDFLNCPGRCHSPQDRQDLWESFERNGGVSPGEAVNAALHDGVTSQMLLELAKHRLEHEVDLFGIVECFNASMIYIGKLLGWNLEQVAAGATQKHRAGSSDFPMAVQGSGDGDRHRRALSAVDAKAIEDNNKLDVELYRFARGLLRRRMREVDPVLRCP